VTQAEVDAGITYHDLGIELYRDYGQIKVHCPRCHGDRRNQSDKSLSVDVDQGTWTCHHPGCNWVSGLTAEAAKRTGTGAPPPANLTRVSTEAAAPKPMSPLPTELEPWALDYFETLRHITEPTLRAFGVVSSERVWNGKPAHVLHFPYYSGGILVNAKHRAVKIGGIPSKEFRQEPGAVRTMFGMNVCPPDARAVVLVEGEIDALSVYEIGWANVISLPDGAAKHAQDGKLAALLDPPVKALLDAATIVVIATDADEPGQACRDALIEVIGAVKCWTVQWPDDCNDANAVLVKHGADALDAVLEKAKPVDLPGVHDFSEDYEDVLRIYEHGHEPGASTGWSTLDELVTLHKGSVYLCTGIPSHGKTSMMVAMLMNAVKHHEWRGAMFNPEMGNAATILSKLAQLTAAAPMLPGAQERMSRETLIEAMEWVRERIWLIDAAQQDDEGYATLGLPELLTRAEAAHLRHGIDFLYIDPWNRLDAARPRHMTATEYVSFAMNALGRFARRHNILILLVAHPTKQDAGKSGEHEAMPTPYSISDSAHWYAMADVILGVHREKYDPDRKDITTVRTWKVREEGDTGNLGQCQFRFDPRSRRFFPLDIPIPERIGTDSFVGAFTEVR
jgi:twinkle protein